MGKKEERDKLNELSAILSVAEKLIDDIVSRQPVTSVKVKYVARVFKVKKRIAKAKSLTKILSNCL